MTSTSQHPMPDGYVPSLESLMKFKEGNLTGPEAEWVEAWVADSRLGAEVLESLNTESLAVLSGINASVQQQVATAVGTSSTATTTGLLGWKTWIAGGIAAVGVTVGIITYSGETEPQLAEQPPATEEVTAPVEEPESTPIIEEEVPEELDINPDADGPGMMDDNITPEMAVPELVEESRESTESPETTVPESDPDPVTVNQPDQNQDPPTLPPDEPIRSKIIRVNKVQVMGVQMVDETYWKSRDKRNNSDVTGGQLGSSKKSRPRPQSDIAIPEYEGGDQAIEAYVKNEIRDLDRRELPLDRRQALVRFSVSSKGKVGEVEIIRSINKNVDSEIISVLNKMSGWKPGKGGKKGWALYTLTINFDQ